MKIDRAIRSTRVVTPEGERPAAVLVGDGKIVDIVAHDATPKGIPLDDWGDLAILPGLVDTHVHCNEPGRTEWEGFETATKSAIAGGVTTIVDMPLNSSPVTTTAEAFRQKLAATEGKLWCDVGFWGGLVAGGANRVQELIDAGVLGFKAFLCDSGIDEFPAATEADLLAAMPIIAQADVPLLVHGELVSRIGEVHQDPRKYATWLRSRPAVFEHDALKLMFDLCIDTGCKTHIVHLADADCDDLLSEWTVISEYDPQFKVETCPHYLHFAAEDVPDGATEFKCAPPIRSRENRERLWGMLLAGNIDMIVSDHSPCVPDLKCRESGDFLKAWGGIASLQLGLSIIWTNAKQRGIPLERLTRWMSMEPARCAGITGRKGSISHGCDADFAVFDTEHDGIVDAEKLFHRHKLTPYLGARLTGEVKATYLRGELVYRNGSFLNDQPNGKTILRTVAAVGQRWSRLND